MMDRAGPIVLLIDDREDNLFSLKSILNDTECRVMTALSGREGIELLESHDDIACVLLDVNMPGMDGFEVAKKIKLSPKCKDIPIVFVTAVEISTEKSKVGYELGAVDYLIKPLSPSLVRSKVESYCQLYRSK